MPDFNRASVDDFVTVASLAAQFCATHPAGLPPLPRSEIEYRQCSLSFRSPLRLFAIRTETVPLPRDFATHAVTEIGPALDAPPPHEVACAGAARARLGATTAHVTKNTLKRLRIILPH
ncbi:hypothetical protein DVH02_19865 [Streptomyces corynorhini]|uniref:Uncharacterized protein n=1 Tax=Streptomyces corynorhini TaxID=2282652 RepID=A0A370B9G8_9ACTN|nr:hypothetical protein DVH02_19865 [Streptomyces corynorhini]